MLMLLFEIWATMMAIALVCGFLMLLEMVITDAWRDMKNAVRWVYCRLRGKPYEEVW